ncbi:MAG: FAD-binding oxidoreductase [Chloroflexi bacterium]|nr:FAD-binding oxidoreductase [Chloroflexota bacterium]
MTRTEAEVVVVGAGIVGVAAAYYLARAGKRVVVVDRAGIAGEASGRNGGHLSPTIDGAWAPLGQLALDIWPRLIPDIDGPTEYRRGGGLYVVVDHDPMEPADILAYRHARGFVAELLSPEECRRRLPPLRSEIKGGVLSPRHGQVNPILTTKSLAQTAERHFGVKFLLYSPVTSVSVENDAVHGVRVGSGAIGAPTVVLAAGAWTGQLAATAGVACPIGPRRIQILLSEAMPPWTDVVWAGNGVYARQSLSGHLHFGSGGPAWERTLAEVSYTVAPGGMQRAARRMCDFMPGLRDVAILRSWAGVIGPSADGVPVLEACAEPRGLIIASGFGGNGFVTGPAVGQVVAELATAGRASADLSGLSLARFTASPSGVGA